MINEERARIAIPSNRPLKGYWFGGGNMIETTDGSLYVLGRYRNDGDSRTGLDLGDRGLELAIFESKDKGKAFQKVHSIMKTNLPRGVLAIEGTTFNINAAGKIELYISSEKSQNTYPLHLSDYLKKGTGVWSIDVVTADHILQSTADKVKPLLSCNNPEYIHVKDPFYYRSYTGAQYLMFCTYPFTWSSSNTTYMKRKGEDISFEEPVWEFFRRGYTWDVAMTRGTCVLDMPQIGVLKDKRMSLCFYDGGESLRNMDQHEKAVKGPRGYSCEELGGLAYIENVELNSIRQISIKKPLFLIPYGTACSRYVSVLTTKDGMYALWQQSQEDCSQPLVMNFLSTEEIAALLS